MIAGPPPFYARFLRSVFSPERNVKREDRPDDEVAIARQSVRLLAKPERKLLEQAATALKALPPPDQMKPDVLTLPDRDHLRSVVPDLDHLQYGE